MDTKAQLIKSNSGSKSNPTGYWYTHDEIKPFIMGIETGDILENLDPETLNSLTGGNPTIWARAKIIGYAFNYLQYNDANIKPSGLINIFHLLSSEWKGLVALLALFPDRIRFSEPLFMDPLSDDLYDIADSFGKMLFDDIDLWCNQERIAKNPDEKPFIQLIYYNDQLVGATSPFSVVFSGVDYSDLKQTQDVKWYRNGRFEDPTRYLDSDQLQKLYSFIANINSNFKEYEELINSQRNNKPRLDLIGLKKVVREWKVELENKGKKLADNIPSVKYNNLYMPFKVLLASEQAVYVLKDGSMTFSKPEEGLEFIDYSVLQDLQDLFLDSNRIIGWYESTDTYQPLHGSSVHYLSVGNTLRNNGVKGDNLYFALPLSAEGINVFHNTLSTLLGASGNKRLEAFVNEGGKLQVDLVVEIDRNLIKLNTREYEIEWDLGNKKVLLWPNFTSDNWNAYYLYSEFPSNAANTKFVPFFKQKGQVVDSHTNFRKKSGIIENNPNEFVYANSSVRNQKNVKLKVETIVKYPQGLVNEDVPAYEIIKSNRPIAGLNVRIDDKNCGYLILKEGQDTIKDRSNDDSTIVNAIVGLDFGSSNSCCYYRIEPDKQTYPVSFSNRRVALVGVDILHDSVAHDSELLFFQNAEGMNGQIKSWLHEHHPLASVNKDSDDELAGGVPVNEKNIQIENMDRNSIITQAGKLHYNMKWLSDISGRLKKTAYLKTVWLQICADLYDEKTNRCIPSKLCWSYPGSMSEVDKNQYRMIFENSLPTITPIEINGIGIRPETSPPITESEAVCGYALSKEIGLTEDKLFLGIDVGGSTSDILLLVKGRDENNRSINKLLKQSSVRIAAGVFFDAIIQSQKFKQELFNFHENKGSELDLNVIGIGDLLDSTKKEIAPFYLTSIFDQLKGDDFKEFYQFIGTRSSFVFTIPSFVTGLLVYYAGQLVANSFKNENITSIKKIDLLTFGKGGRLFFWLDTYPGKHKAGPYLETCFRKGFGEGAQELSLNTRSDIRYDNKSEVAMGLVSGNRDKLYIDKSLRNNSDIFGEKGISVNINGVDNKFNEDDILYSEYFSAPDEFTFPSKFENFNEFLTIYLDFVGAQTDMVSNTTVLEKRANELKERLTSYLSNDPEWKKANKIRESGKQFDYRFPFIIAEGLCYLESILIPEVFKV